MTQIELATMIGDILTQIDTRLQTPGLSDADWETLYALRKHLDDEQRDLIRSSIDEDDAKYKSLTEQIEAASERIKNTIDSIAKVGQVISTIAQVASWIDEIVKIVPV